MLLGRCWRGFRQKVSDRSGIFFLKFVEVGGDDEKSPLMGELLNENVGMLQSSSCGMRNL